MKRHSIFIALFFLFGSAAFAQQNDCHLMMDKSYEGNRVKATKRAPLVDLPDFAMGIMLQNTAGDLQMILDITIVGKRITKEFDRDKQCTLGFVLENGALVKLDVKEPKPRSGGRLQSWGNYEIGGMMDVNQGKIDTLQQSPVKALLFSFYSLPEDTIAISNATVKDYFIKNLPCVKIEKK